MTKFICLSIAVVTMFFASQAHARANWDAFAGGLANGLSGQQLYTPPAPEPQFMLRGNPAPSQRMVEIIDYSTGRIITLDRQTGEWRDDRGNFGRIR